jgi:phosphatidylinositol alpha-mannosyltransferase
MKIGLVCPYSINKHGGVLEVVLALYEGLRARGHEVRIITPKPRNHAEEANSDVIFFGTSTDFRTLSFTDTTTQVSSTADVERIDEILLSEKFDILNFHEPWMPLLSRQLLQRSNAVNIGTFHSKVTEARVSRAVLRIVYPYLSSVLGYLDELTAVSDSAADYVSNLTEQPITIIPNGIDTKKYKWVPRTPAVTGAPTILYIGRLERRKGAKFLLQAFQLLQQENPNVRLLVAGDGPDREKLELLAEDLKLQNVTFLGYVSEELKIKLLSEADIFCSPALFGESFGIVLLESMATGTITIAGNNSGYIGLMQDLGALSIVNPQDPEEFARRLHLLLNQPELRALWEKWAKQYVKQFDYKQVVSQYEDFYREALKQHGSGR